MLTEAHADAAEVPTLAPSASFLFRSGGSPNPRRAAAAAPPLPSPPPPPPPRPPPPLQLRGPGARAGGSGVARVGPSSTGVTVVLVAAVVGGGFIGSRLYRLGGVFRPNARSGHTRLRARESERKGERPSS